MEDQTRGCPTSSSDEIHKALYWRSQQGPFRISLFSHTKALPNNRFRVVVHKECIIAHVRSYIGGQEYVQPLVFPRHQLGALRKAIANLRASFLPDEERCLPAFKRGIGGYYDGE